MHEALGNGPNTLPPRQFSSVTPTSLTTFNPRPALPYNDAPSLSPSSSPLPSATYPRPSAITIPTATDAAAAVVAM